MIKALKMQENLMKLNEFCKKKMHKHPGLKLHKKRNATILVKDISKQNEGEETKITLKSLPLKEIHR